LFREVESAFELGGFEFGHDAGVWVSPQLLHHDARYFPERKRILPERFVKGRLAGSSASVYLPFGVGRRACIGGQLALQEMTLIALLTARRFTLVPALDGAAGFRVRARSSTRHITCHSKAAKLSFAAKEPGAAPCIPPEREPA